MRRKTEVKAVKTEIRGLELQIKIPFGAYDNSVLTNISTTTPRHLTALEACTCYREEEEAIPGSAAEMTQIAPAKRTVPGKRLLKTSATSTAAKTKTTQSSISPTSTKKRKRKDRATRYLSILILILIH
ncbi:hypothetical protein C6341_g5028 [Phytophthora cactorum]|nr:hypothetical protein PC120_g15296 [Phytophthora cactorum]KAG3184351.1 hypothetical protein C6341_g5028 [Phytophthora cactorum]